MLDIFKGIFPALLTPFDENNQVNEKELRRLIRYNLDQGAKGFYVCGSTAEVFLLTDEERRLIYRTVADEAKGNCTLIAHVGAVSTDQAVRYARYAEELGYDAVSAVAPFYYKFSFEQIRSYYFAIADAVRLPVIIYNFPSFSGVNLTLPQIETFLKDDRFIGIKHTSSDYFMLEQIKMHYPNKVVYNGYDEMFLAGVTMGADGGIGSTYNFMTDKFIRIQAYVKQGELKKAQEIQASVNRVVSALCKVGVMEGEKEVLCQLGFDFGRARSPFSTLTEEQRLMIRDVILPELS